MEESPDKTRTVASLLERYALEVVPAPMRPRHRPKTPGSCRPYQRPSDRHPFRTRVHVLVNVHGRPVHIYQYVDARSAKTAAKREIEVLSHAFG